MQQRDADLLGPEVAEARGGGADEVVQLGDRLDAEEAAAGHHKRQQRAPPFTILLDVRLFQGVNDAVAQRQRVAQVLERQRVLGQAGEPAIITLPSATTR